MKKFIGRIWRVFKNRLFFLFLFLPVFSSMIFIGYMWISVLPMDRIEQLRNSFPVREVKSNRMTYKYVLNKPKNWTPLSRISKKLQDAIIVSEDWAFYEHFGFDIQQLRDAVAKIISGKRVRGASTITQQVAKNLFLTNEKSYWRKFKELLLSLRLEQRLDKARILEIYLNIIEFGKDIYGISNATEYYFEKQPDSIMAREGAFIAMLLPSPVRYGQSFKDKKLTDYASKIVNQILEKMVIAKLLTEDEKNNEQMMMFSWEME